MADNIKKALDTVFAHISESYERRGINRRIGFGGRAALLIVDMANAWTRPGRPFSCDGIDAVIDGVRTLLQAFRAKGLPVIYTTTAYQVTDGGHTDMVLWNRKIPSELLRAGSEDVAIDDRIAPQSGEPVIVKKNASAFHGTALSGMLRAMGVDTVVVAGATACGCVRASVQDALAEGFRPIVVRECIGDRAQAAIEWSLFDIDTKFGDVESLQTVLDHLRGDAPARAASGGA